MDNKDVIIICRKRALTINSKKTTLNGFLSWGSHIKNKYLVKKISDGSSLKTIQSKIQNNTMMPEWIGNNRFGSFDLINYLKNNNRLVHDPSSDPKFFNPIDIPTGTSIHIYEYLLKKGYNPINIENIEPHRKELAKVLNGNPLAVVVSSTFFVNAYEIKGIVDIIRTVNKKVPIIIGGMALLTHLDSNQQLEKDYQEILNGNIFFIVEEYGLNTLHVLLKKIIDKKSLKTIPNIVYKTKNEIFFTEQKQDPIDFDSIYPDWSFPTVASAAKNVAFIRSSQGCAFKCKFCTFPKSTIINKERSVSSLQQELKTIHDAGIENFAFTDDHFATNPKRMENVCKMIIKEKFNFNWYAGIRASSINEENAKLLYESGCKAMCIGLESGDDHILKLMNKKTTASKNMKCLELLSKYDILVHGSFMIGFPGETQTSIQNTINWVNSSPLKLYKIWLFYLLQGSIIYDEQDQHEISYFKDYPDYNLWKTPTLDAFKASELVKSFILQITDAALIYNYSPMYCFFPFYIKGYTNGDIIKLFKMHTKLIKNELSDKSWFGKNRIRKQSLLKMKELMLNRSEKI